jgi:hypothetical protein
MFIFLDGQPVVLTFEQVEGLFYNAFINEFGELSGVSLAQWKGSYEYQAMYPAIQLMVENGVITNEMINEVLLALTETNAQLKRPAVLVSRVPERFAEAGYVATIREADIVTAGIVAICVDYSRDPVHLDRVLTVGNDGGIAYGFSGFGSLVPDSFNGQLINELVCYSDYSQPTRMNSNSLQFPDHLTTVDVFFVGLGLVTFTWNGVTFHYENSDTLLADFIVLNDTLDVDLYFTADDTFTPATIADDETVRDLIALEMLPAGQFMEGDVMLPYVLTNGQTINIAWSTPTDELVQWKYTITRDRNSSFPVDDVDTIVSKFDANFLAQNPLGNDITPDTYLTTVDLPWASKIVATYSLNGGAYTDAIYEATFNQKFLSTLEPADVVIV